MDRQRFLDDLDSLPAEAQREVNGPVASLNKRHRVVVGLPTTLGALSGRRPRVRVATSRHRARQRRGACCGNVPSTATSQPECARFQDCPWS